MNRTSNNPAENARYYQDPAEGTKTFIRRHVKIFQSYLRLLGIDDLEDKISAIEKDMQHPDFQWKNEDRAMPMEIDGEEIMVVPIVPGRKVPSMAALEEMAWEEEWMYKLAQMELERRENDVVLPERDIYDDDREYNGW